MRFFFIAAIPLAFLLYGHGLDAPFYLDDGHVLETGLGALPSTRPLGFYSFYVSSMVADLLGPLLHWKAMFYFRVTNLLIHVLAATAVFWLAWELAKKHLVAAIAGTLFLVHPIQSQPVLYVTQRFESLATLFMVLSAAGYARFRNSHDRRWLIAVLGFGVLAAFSKETAVVLPLWIVLIELTSFRTWRWDRRFFFLIPVGLLLAIPAWRAFTGSGVTLTSVPWPQYIASQGGVLLKYLQLSLYPYEQFLFYDVGVVTEFSWSIVLEWVLVLSVLTTGIVLIRRYPTIGFGIVTFFVMLLPVTLLPLPDLIFEHRIYPAFVGLSIAAASLLALRVQRATIVLMAVLLVVFCFRTFERSGEWNDEVQFLEAHRERFPHDPQALATLAVYYFGRGEVASGIEALETAREHEDHFNDYDATSGRVNIALNLATMYISSFEYDLARREVELALMLDPDEPAVYQLAGGFYLTVGELDAALANYVRLTELNPSAARGWMGLNQTYTRLEDEVQAAEAIARLQDLSDARPERAGWMIPPEYRTYGVFALLLMVIGAVFLAVRSVWMALRQGLASG